MTEMKGTEAKVVLLVEDEPAELVYLKVLFEQYRGDVKTKVATNVGEALDALDPTNVKGCQVAVVLDIMLPYGDVKGRVTPDPYEIDSGILLLERLRETESAAGVPPTWVAVITARSGVGVEVRVDRLVSRGRGRLYKKPFNTHQLKHDVATALGVQSDVPRELLDEERAE